MNAWPFPSRDACGRALFADLAGGGGAVETGKQGRNSPPPRARRGPSRPAPARRRRASEGARGGRIARARLAFVERCVGRYHACVGRDGGARGSERVRVARSRRRGEASSSRATFGTAPGGALDPLEDFRFHRVLPSNKHVEIFLSFSEIPVDAKRAVNHPREDRRFEYRPRPKSTNWNPEWSRTCSVTPPSDGCRGLREDARTRMSIRTTGRCIGIVTRYAHLSRGRWVGRTRPRGRLRRGRRDVHFRCQTTKDRFSGSATPEGRAPPRRWTSREGKEPEWHSPPEEGDSSPRAAASARAGPVRGVVGQSITVGKETVTRE